MNITHNRPDLLRIALCLMLIFVPLVYVPEIFLYTRLPKRSILFVFIALATLGWWLRIRKQQTISWPSSPATGFLIGLVTIAAISSWACCSTTTFCKTSTFISPLQDTLRRLSATATLRPCISFVQYRYQSSISYGQHLASVQS